MSVKPSDLKGVGAWRKTTIVRVHHHRQPAIRKQAELETKLREMDKETQSGKSQ